MTQPFRYALVGAGMVADVFHRAAAASDGRMAVEVVVARSQDARDRVAATHGCRMASSLGAVLAEGGVDAVILATPPDARAAMVAACTDAGMPVLAEKPLERTADAAAALVARMGTVPFGVVLQHRMRAASRAARDAVDGGALGAPRLLRVDVPWWRDPGYYAQPGRGTLARDGGGVMITQAIHALDLGLWLTGAPVVRVRGGTARALHDLEGEDTAAALIDFKGGAVGVFTATTAAYPGRSEIVELTCEHGTLRLGGGALTVLHRDGRQEVVGEEGGSGGGADPMAFPLDAHQAVMLDFAGAVRAGRPPFLPASAALPVQRCIDAIARAG
ncbi:Gfo/Idh/MocA family oxidoreductase [Jannaschia sp. LMIT008]|uniref:Gfo/Idh/MocA family protein n=1 Tax=Jannaschia maritima TaxID=3032585 RepID=UPI0028117D3B|nr:Gfo/Idh/MocA family oxidoreductase [Jannaschia sp. LMIT008]